MKALKTIVATAVIVFALTTVAVAGAQRIGSPSDAARTAGATATRVHQTAGQGVKLHAKQADRATTRARVRDTSRHMASDSAVHMQAQQRTQSQNASGGTHHAVTHHDGGTHHAGTHHDGGACSD